MPRRFRVVHITKAMTAEELMREEGLNPEVYYVVRDQRVLLPRESVLFGEVVAILPLIAGG